MKDSNTNKPLSELLGLTKEREEYIDRVVLTVIGEDLDVYETINSFIESFKRGGMTVNELSYAMYTYGWINGVTNLITNVMKKAIDKGMPEDEVLNILKDSEKESKESDVK